MKSQVVFFFTPGIFFPTIVFCCSARVLESGEMHGNASYFQHWHYWSNFLLRKWVNPPFLHGSIDFVLKGKTYASFTFRQYMSVYLLYYMDNTFRGFFFFLCKPTRPTLPVCSHVSCLKYATIYPSRTGFSTAVCASACTSWLFSLLLLSSLTLIQQYKFTSVVQGSVQPVVLGVLCSSDSAYSEEQVLSAAHRATSILCVWAMCYSHWACWDPWTEQ